jgi:hypothetical protein
MKALLYSGAGTEYARPSPRFTHGGPSLTDPLTSWASFITSIAEVLKAVAWPLVAAFFLIAYRVRITFLLKVLGRKLSAAKKIKAGPVEVDTGEELVKEAVDSARSQAASAAPLKDDAAKPRDDPDEQIKNALKDAANLDKRLEEAKTPESAAKFAVRKAIFRLAEEYDALRSKMPSSPSRTTKMNEIAAGMRTLAFEGLSLRTELTRSNSAGQRLAAICMLQVEPRPRYLRWLIERVKSETQAFVLFQASLAIREHVKKGFYVDPGETRSEILEALDIVSAFPGGKPDQNTLDVLNESLSLLR